MDKNDVIIRLRYAKDIKNNDIIKIFALEGEKKTKEQVIEMLKKSTYTDDNPDGPALEGERLDNITFEKFLNGYITFNRGPAKVKPGAKPFPKYQIMSDKDINNVMIKKLKIALNLTSDDMIDVFKAAGLTVSPSEITALMRKKGHKHYRECGDNFARNFLLGLTKLNRG